MRTILWAALLMAAMSAVSISCKSDNSTGPVTGQGKISGTVIDKTTKTPLADVKVSATSFAGGTAATTTDANGLFNISLPVDSTSAATLLFQKSGWRDTTIVYPIGSNTITQVTIVLSPTSVIGNTGGSGLAQTIAFLGASPQEIAVRGVGGLETALLTWEVRDSLGLPIDAAHALTLSITIQNGPGGGEYVSPSPITTNTVGQAFTTVTSGIRSGVMQIVASGTVGTRVITTTPVRVVIDAGFPDQTHFTIAAPIYNLPVLQVVNVHSPVTVLIGDRWTNPVAAGTAVYFRSSAGVMQPSVFTDKNGQGTADLISGNPLPIGAGHAAVLQGDGYHYIVGRTIDQNGLAVTDSILVLWSGHPIITPTSFASNFDILNDGSQTFTFTVADYLGHPMAAGTTITVSATVPPPSNPNDAVNQVTVGLFPGQNGSYTLPDVLLPGPGATDFTCRLSDGTSNINQQTRVTLSVSVSGPNGAAVYTIDGYVH